MSADQQQAIEAFEKMCASHRKHFTETLQGMADTLAGLSAQQGHIAECQVRLEQTTTTIGQDVSLVKQILLGNGGEGIDEQVRGNCRWMEEHKKAHEKRDRAVRGVFGDVWRAALPVVLAALVGAGAALFAICTGAAQ